MVSWINKDPLNQVSIPETALTSYNNGIYTVSYSNNDFEDSSYPIWKVFDQISSLNDGQSIAFIKSSNFNMGNDWNTQTNFNSYKGSTSMSYIDTSGNNITINGAWIQLGYIFDFIPTKILMRPWNASYLDNSPGEFYLVGSNNGTVWNYINKFTGLNNSIITWLTNEIKEFVFNNIVSYKYLRIIVTKVSYTGQTPDGGGSISCMIDEIIFQGYKFPVILNDNISGFTTNNNSSRLAMCSSNGYIYTGLYTYDYIWTKYGSTPLQWTTISSNYEGNILVAGNSSNSDNYLHIGYLQNDGTYLWYKETNNQLSFTKIMIEPNSSKLDNYIIASTQTNIYEISFTVDQNNNFTINYYNDITPPNIDQKYWSFIHVSTYAICLVNDFGKTYVITNYTKNSAKTWNYQFDQINSKFWMGAVYAQTNSQSVGYLVMISFNGDIYVATTTNLNTLNAQSSTVITNSTKNFQTISINNSGSKVIVGEGNGYVYIGDNFSNNQYNWTKIDITGSWTNIQSDIYGDKFLGINNNKIYMSVLEPSCYLKNTKILTINGYKNIQDLTINELVMTPIGWKSIKFISYNKFNYYEFPNITYKLPKNSIKLNEPFEDLYILHWHSLIYDNLDYINLYKKESYDENTYKIINKIPDYYKLLSRDHNKCILVDSIDLQPFFIDNYYIEYYNIVLDINETDINGNYIILANGILSETITNMAIDKSNNI